MRSRGEDRGQLARLVHHATGAGDSASLLRLAPAAAEHASRLGAHREAEQHLAAALRHAAELAPRRRAELLDAYALECYMTDRMADGIEARTAACSSWRELGEPIREGDGLIGLSRMLWFETRSQEAREAARRAVETLERLPPTRELALAWSNRASLHAAAGERAPAIELCHKALQLARAHGCKDIEAHALNTLGCACVADGDEQGWSHLDDSLGMALREDLPRLQRGCAGDSPSWACAACREGHVRRDASIRSISPPASRRCSPRSHSGFPTKRSARGCSCRPGRWTTTSRRSSPSWV